ncbi:MAG: disulfide bond formation protein B [Gammaproteobacteria bacterium]|nr:disulfide bond formation protein B [Gammaproteobacteria bacterium]
MHSIKSLIVSPSSRGWWIVLASLCVFLEGVALFYQYQLGYLPCVLCVHIRMLLGALLLVSILALLIPPKPIAGLVLLLLATLIWLWMLERSWQVLGVEMGFIMGECQMSSGLPQWLALESWFPFIFKIHEPCGYTPYVFFKVSMAHILLAISAFFSLICVASLITKGREHFSRS